MNKKVMISGCFDLLHSGHIAFFQEAATYGDLYVALGADRTIFDLKGRAPVNNEQERLYMVKSIGCVKDAFVSRGSGILDFIDELRELHPDYFVVNEDGNTPAKLELCEELGVEYVVLKRTPHSGLEARSTTALRTINLIPYRIDLAGGWLDQPYVSKYCPGAVITVGIEPTIEFNERSGMASSTRRKAIEMWGARLPVGPEEKLAKMLFCYDNPPGTKIISGAQDSIGIVLPGVNYSYFDGQYWPKRIERVNDAGILDFIEASLFLIPLGPRVPSYDVLKDTHINRKGAHALAEAADACWKAILAKDIRGFGESFRQSFEAQIAMFPNMVNEMILNQIEQYRSRALGWKLSGAGGGGYLIFVAEKPLDHGFMIQVRHKESL